MKLPRTVTLNPKSRKKYGDIFWHKCFLSRPILFVQLNKVVALSKLVGGGQKRRESWKSCHKHDVRSVMCTFLCIFHVCDVLSFRLLGDKHEASKKITLRHVLSHFPTQRCSMAHNKKKGHRRTRRKAFDELVFLLSMRFSWWKTLWWEIGKSWTRQQLLLDSNYYSTWWWWQQVRKLSFLNFAHLDLP